MKNYKWKIIAVFSTVSFAAFLVLALPVRAAEMSVHASVAESGPGSTFKVGFFLDTQGDSINAIEGKVSFPADLFEIKNISESDSLISLWVKRPVAATAGEIAFSGIVPGGFDGQGPVFSVTVIAKKIGAGQFMFSSARVLRNDGSGTESPLTLSGQDVVVSAQAPLSEAAPSVIDADPPEAFTPQIASDPSLFGGKWFLVFATADKGSGIDRYLVCEGKSACVVAESPYFLKDQDLDADIVVKALDKGGNERLATVTSPVRRSQYKKYAILAIMILAALSIICCLFVWRVRKRSNSQ